MIDTTLIGTIGVYITLKEHLSKTPDLHIIEIVNPVYAEDPEAGEKGARYDLGLKVENTGREPTTIKSASVFIDSKNERLALTRREGSTLSHEIMENPPREVDPEIRIPANGVSQVLMYRIVGEPRNDYNEPVDGKVTLEAVGGVTCERSTSFVPREPTS